jgi:hypothetical protein
MVMKKAPEGMVGQQFTCKTGYTPTLEDIVSVSGDFEVEKAVANHPIGTVVAIDTYNKKVTVELFSARIMELTAAGAVVAGNHIKPAAGGAGAACAAGPATVADLSVEFAIALNGAADTVKFSAVPLR